LRPDALYEFVVASDGGTREDLDFRVTFTEPDDAGNQQMRVLRADGAAARQGIEGTLLGEGLTGEVFPLGVGGLARVRLEGLHGGVCGERQPRGGRGQPAGVLEDAAGRSFPAELAAPPSQAMTMT